MEEKEKYHQEIFEIRKEIDTIDEMIIKFIIAISQKVQASVSYIGLNQICIPFPSPISKNWEVFIDKGIIRFSVNNEEVCYTLNFSLDDEEEVIKSYKFITDYITSIIKTRKENWNWKGTIIKKWLLNLIFKRMRYSLEVAKVKLKYKEKILDVTRRDKMIENRILKGEKYSQEEEMKEKIKKIFKFLHDESCLLQAINFLNTGEDINVEDFIEELNNS